ncbi:class I SAM-dependent methyltransferase [Aggregatilineales bacterium SYSU G02658]
MNIKNNFPERIVPGQVFESGYANHIKRYDFALSFVAGRSVLDVACGVGYGTAHLADGAAHVVGVDIDEGSVRYAQGHYMRPNAAFSQADAHALPFADHCFEVVVSFETIEHVPDVQQYLAEVKRVLHPEGVYLASTPAAKVSTRRPPNPHHVQEWSPADFEALLSAHFRAVEIYSQHELKQAAAAAIKSADRLNLRLLIPKPIRLMIARALGLRTMYDVTVEHLAITPGIHPDATEIVAVCREPLLR